MVELENVERIDNADVATRALSQLDRVDITELDSNERRAYCGAVSRLGEFVDEVRE